jgi:hypothetical protein
MDANGHIYELVMYQDHPWSVEDIMLQATDADAADGFTMVGYAWKAAGTKHLVYSGRDGHLHELSTGPRGAWKHSDLTQMVGASPAENSPLAACAWETGKQRLIMYVSEDGHIHELMSGIDGSWKDTDLMAVVEAPLAGDAALAAYAWEAGGTKQVVYVGEDGDVYELVGGQNGKWAFTDLTALTGAPLAKGSALAASAWETGGSKYVTYVGSNNHIYELQMPLQGSWEHADLTQLARAPEASEDVIATHEWTPEFAKHIVYLDTSENPHIHSLMLKHGSPWQHMDVTSLTGAQPIV